jgi:uncharacterized protein (DUF488 family)
MAQRIYTIGHSNHAVGAFIRLLLQHGLDVIGDVRSVPFSRHHPQFNRDVFSKALQQASVAYLYMGNKLGGRPADDTMRDEDGRADYDKIRETSEFVSGIDDIERGLPRWPGRIALLCGEEDPSTCHRRRLVGAALVDRGVELVHIRGDGRLETEDEVRARLYEDQPTIFDMFGSGED